MILINQLHLDPGFRAVDISTINESSSNEFNFSSTDFLLVHHSSRSLMSASETRQYNFTIGSTYI